MKLVMLRKPWLKGADVKVFWCLFLQHSSVMAPKLQTPEDTLKPLSTACRLTPPPPLCCVFVVCKVRSHVAALKSSGSVASSNSSTSTAPPVVLRSQSFGEPLASSFENLHLRHSQEPHQQHHHPPSSSSSASSTPARTDPQSHSQPRPSPNEPAPSEEALPRVSTGRERCSAVC